METPLITLCRGCPTLKETKDVLAFSKKVLNKQNQYKNTCLHYASNDKRNEAVVLYLIDQGADLTIRNDVGDTALHNALESKFSLSAVKKMVENYPNFNVNISNHYSQSLLFYAAKGNQTDVIKYLLTFNPELNRPDRNKSTILQQVLMASNEEIVNLMIDKGVKAKLELSLALKRDMSIPTIKRLVEEAKADINVLGFESYPPIQMVLQRKDEKLLRYFISKKVKLNIKTKYSYTPLGQVLDFIRYSGGLKLLKIMIEEGNLKPHGTNGDGYNIVQYGCAQQCVSLIKYGFSLKISLETPTKRGITPLVLLLKQKPTKTLECLKYLLEKGVDIQKKVNKCTPFQHYIMSNGLENAAIVDLLLEHGASYKDFPEGVLNPLHFLIINNNSPTKISNLIKNGVDINYGDHLNNTPLMYASGYKKKSEIHNHYMRLGARTISGNYMQPVGNFIDFFDQSLQRTWKCYTTNIEYVKELLNFEPDVNKANNKGRTPLHAACYYHATEAVKLLLENGADPEYKDMNGKTPLDFQDEKALIKLMKSYLTVSRQFARLLKREEHTDAILGGKKIHKFWVEYRTGKSIQQLKNNEKNFKNENWLQFLEWVYTGNGQSSEAIQKMFKVLEINIDEKKSLKNDLKSLYEQENTKDYTIIVQKKEIKIHRFLLQARSDLYRGMFMNVETIEPKIHDFSQRSYEALNEVIKFMYFDEIDVKKLSNEVIEELQDAVEYYQLDNNSKLKLVMKKAAPKIMTNNKFYQQLQFDQNPWKWDQQQQQQQQQRPMQFKQQKFQQQQIPRQQMKFQQFQQQIPRQQQFKQQMPLKKQQLKQQKPLQQQLQQQIPMQQQFQQQIPLQQQFKQQIPRKQQLKQQKPLQPQFQQQIPMQQQFQQQIPQQQIPQQKQQPKKK
ncbi:ankyrin repeat-containing protein [Anaeramoeba flamelloides]|uniref:Ankyrin repeat-containing protein n=1 Tax=Anaeramoeba flamelloides TaxID=1746091 RepID=A0AAV7Z6I2_9EUKA|nr:ankyrin repeat-containing protein [Anaeramoeba flamelloides]